MLDIHFDGFLSPNSRIKFFNGDAANAVEHISCHGGSVAAPGVLEGDLTK